MCRIQCEESAAPDSRGPFPQLHQNDVVTKKRGFQGPFDLTEAFIVQDFYNSIQFILYRPNITKYKSASEGFTICTHRHP